MKSKRHESIKIIVSEAIMVLTVVITVIVLAFIVSGYWLNSDFEVERQGMLQISSIPTGADISIDNEKPSWSSRTNTSKVLTSGEHTIKLSKKGYDTWSKTINISEGLLYRLHYPRLFLKERTKESVLDIGTATLATVSPDHNRLILINNTSEWLLVDLDLETPKTTKLDISKYFSGISVAEDAKVGLFSNEILSMNWDSDSTHLLLKTKYEDNLEWVLLDINNLDKSINLSKEFSGNFSKVKILDHSSSTLLVVQNNNLQRIDLSNKSISSVLVEDIIDFDHYNNDVVFSAKNTEKDASSEYYLGFFKIGDNATSTLQSLSSPARVLISKFYDETYITTLHDNTIIMHQKDDYDTVSEYQLSFVPDDIQIGHNGEFIVFSKDTTIATLDMEANIVQEWNIENPVYNWLDNDMIYNISNDKLIVYDYDGLNRREIAENTSPLFPATITDDRWLYYFKNGSLIREWLIEH